MHSKLLGDDNIKSVALRKSMDIMGKSIIWPGGPRRIAPSQMLAYAQNLRDVQIWKMPILPGAIQIFQQLSSGREWQIVGKPLPAKRAVDWLNRAKVVDVTTGLPQYGFEEFLKRRSLDFTVVGRTSFTVTGKTKAEPNGFLEYLDPTMLQFTRPERNGEVRPTDKVWTYTGDMRKFRAGDVYLNHTLPLGGSGLFISPIAYVMPTANLAWLIREHDMASTDGRRIRDIIIVGSSDLAASIEEAVLTQIALHSGEDPSKVGIPIVEMNNLTGTSVEDQITTLGLSKIPEGFEREEFVFDYVNQISAALGLSLRHFWNSERTTNRALEEIQEQRQLQKGPSSYVRSEERQINQSGILKPFSSGRSRLQFNFIEEVDTSSMVANAQVLKLTTEALEKVATVFQAGLSLEALLSWMQSIHVLPNDLELIATGTGTSDMASAESLAVFPVPKEGEEIENGSQPPQESPSKSAYSEPVPDYDEVSVDSHGNIRERRFKVFTTYKAILNEKLSKMEVEDEPQVSDEDAYEAANAQVQLNNRNTLKNFFGFKRELIAQYSGEMPLYTPDQIETALNKVVSDQPLTLDEQTICDFMADKLTPV
jgi:hypothetical protein